MYSENLRESQRIQLELTLEQSLQPRGERKRRNFMVTEQEDPDEPA